MKRQLRIMLTAAAFAAVTLLVTGCGTTQINGAPFYRQSEEQDRVHAELNRQYREAKALQDAKKSRANLATGQRHHAGPDVPATEYVSTAEQPTSPDTLAALRPMNLYGEVSGAARGPASPMDSPGNLKRVSFSTEGADFDPEIDPTGKFLLFASTRHRRTADIYLQKIGGTAVTQLTDDRGNDVMPAFSPDGRKIAFCSDRAGNWDIYVMDLTGNSPPVQVTHDLTHEVHPSFSPDGKHLVFAQFGTQTGQWELAVLEVATPAKKRFICNGLNPVWSPTEDKILFQRARERGTKWFSVWTIDLKDGEGVRPTEIVASDNAAAITPSWSPDGRHIVFCTVVNPDGRFNVDRPVQADVWVIGSDGKGRTNLTNSNFVNVQPIWSPGGQVYFVSNRAKGGVENIWSLSPQKPLAITRSLQDEKTGSATVSVPTDNKSGR